MGLYPDTNNQFAYRTNRRAFLKGIQNRAETLWTDEYRVQPFATEPGCFLVYKEGLFGEEPAGYKVNPIEQTCSCKFYTDQATAPLTEDGSRVPCKHLQGLRLLIGEELAFWKMRFQTATNNGSSDRADSYRRLHNALCEAWETSQDALAATCSSWEEAEEKDLLCCCGFDTDLLP